MYTSVRRYVKGAGLMDALMHRVDEEFAPAISQEPGFVCYFALKIDEEHLETISVFHDQASAERLEQACRRLRAQEPR